MCARGRAGLCTGVQYPLAFRQSLRRGLQGPCPWHLFLKRRNTFALWSGNSPPPSHFLIGPNEHSSNRETNFMIFNPYSIPT